MGQYVDWEPAATISGFLEIAAALVALGYWYMQISVPVVSGGMELAVNGKLGPDVNEHQIGGAGFFVLLQNPVTWILLYFFFEGAVRLGAAALTQTVAGTFPITMMEKLFFLIAARRVASAGADARTNMQSFTASIRERVLTSRLEDVVDELHYKKASGEEVLEIWASRRKEDWTVPKTVRVDDDYYRLEESTVGKGNRPFRYRLRRLEKGVPGRTVILYKSEDALAAGE